MASNATTPTPGRVTRVAHWLFPSRQHVAITLVADAVLMCFGLPLWVHLALGAVFHVAFHLVEGLR